MALEYREYDGTGVVQSRLVVCPFCGHELADYEPRWKHLYTNHTVEDAGLTPHSDVSAARTVPGD